MGTKVAQTVSRFGDGFNRSLYTARAFSLLIAVPTRAADFDSVAGG